MFNVGDEAIRHLFSRGTAYRFSYSSLAVFLTVYFFFACYSSGTDPLLHSCARSMKQTGFDRAPYQQAWPFRAAL
jgi:hypothetical protein